MDALKTYQLKEEIQIDYQAQSVDISETTCLYDIKVQYSPNIELLLSASQMRTERCGIAFKKDFERFLKTRNLSCLPVHEYAVLSYDPQNLESKLKAEKAFFDLSYFERYPKIKENGNNHKPLVFTDFLTPQGEPDIEKLQCIRAGSYLNAQEVYDYKLQYVAAPIVFDATFGNFSDAQYDLEQLKILIEKNPNVFNLKLVRDTDDDTDDDLDSSSPQYLVFHYQASAAQFQLIKKIVEHFTTDETALQFLMTNSYQRIAKCLDWIANIPPQYINPSYNFNQYEQKLSLKIKELAAIFEEQMRLGQDIQEANKKPTQVLKI